MHNPILLDTLKGRVDSRRVDEGEGRLKTEITHVSSFRPPDLPIQYNHLPFRLSDTISSDLQTSVTVLVVLDIQKV